MPLHLQRDPSGDRPGPAAAPPESVDGGEVKLAGPTAIAVYDAAPQVAVGEMSSLSAPSAHGVQPPTLTEVLQFIAVSIRRHLGKGIAVGLGIVLLTAAYLYLAPRTYVSTAKLFVRLGRESVTLEPTAAIGKTMQVAESRESQINSVLEIITGRGIYDEVVTALGPDVVLGLGEVPGEEQALAALGRPHEDEIPTAAHRKAVELLEKTIDVEAVKRSNIIWVAAESSDPLLAKRVLETFIAAAETAYLRNTRPSGSLELFTNRSRDLEADYERQARELADVKSRVDVASLPDRRKTLQDQVSTLELDIAQAETALAKAEATVTGLTEALRSTEQYETQSVSNQPQDARGQAEATLAKLQIELSEAEGRYTARHPKVQRLRDQITRAETILGDANAPEQKTDSISPIWRQLETTRQTEQAGIAATKAELVALRSAREEVRGRLRELNAAEGRIAALEELVTVVKKARGEYAEKREQARMDEVMAERGLSNLTVSQQPTYHPKAVSPKKRLVAAAGLMFACFAALATVLSAEYWDRAGDGWRAALAGETDEYADAHDPAPRPERAALTG